MMKYPCQKCIREQWGDGCDNKDCRLWQQWFLQRWAYTQGIWAGRVRNGHPT